MTAWVQVLVTMVDGPTSPVQGIVRPYRDTDEPIHVYYAPHWEGAAPVLLCLNPDGARLTRHGRKARLETLDGTVKFLCDGDRAWLFADDSDRPRRTSPGGVLFFGPGEELVLTPPARHWVGRNYARPTGPVEDVEFLGRPCWSVELSPRRESEPTRRLVVDAGTGAVLAPHSGDGLEGAAFSELSVGIADPGVFSWDGPVETDGESARKNQQRERHTRNESMEWFRENVGAADLRTPVLTDFTPRSVQVTDTETGEFTAFLGSGEGTGWLSRRPRSRKTWVIDLHGHIDTGTTEDHDWAFSPFRGTLEPEALRRLQRQLHPDQSAVGAPTVHQPSRPDA